MVFKPGEFTPAVGHFYAEAFAAANPELPRGILSVVTRFGATGAALVDAGRQDRVRRLDADRQDDHGDRGAALTQVLLECGRQGRVRRRRRRRRHRCARRGCWSAMANPDQTCVGTERVYVDESVYQQFLTDLQTKLRGIRPGGDGTAKYRPMTMPAQLDVVREHIDDALARGGRALVAARSRCAHRSSNRWCSSTPPKTPGPCRRRPSARRSPSAR